MNDAGRWIRITIFLALLAAGVVFLSSIGGLVKVLVISALLAYIIDPLAVRLEARGMSRNAATSIIFLSITGIFIILLLLFLPVLSSEIASIKAGLSSGEADAMIRKTGKLIEEEFGFLGLQSHTLTKKMNSALLSSRDWVFSHLLDVVSVITNLVIVPFMVFFLLKDGREMKKQLVSIVPNRYFEFSLNMLYKLDLQLGNFLRGQFLDALIFGCLSVIALWVLNVKYYLLIGIFAGLANLIPFLGPIAGATPAIVVSILDTGGFAASLNIILAFAVMKLIDDVLIQPLVVARSVHTHPLLVLVALIIGGKFFGILGMVLSVPVAAFLKIILKEGMLNYRRYHLT